MAGLPLENYNNKTSLMLANMPNIDALAKKGRSGKLVTVPDSLPAGSEVANMAVLGYDVEKVYQGRGVLEAASMGVEIGENDLAMRCNLICVEDNKIKNHSAGHISTKESIELLKSLEEKLGTEKVKFYPGVSYRHLLVIKEGLNDFDCVPPHDVPGTLFRDVLPKAKKEKSETAQLVTELIIKSQEILNNHPINVARKKNGKDSANSIWPWSPGNKPAMDTLQNMYGVSGAVISAVDLLYGIGVYAGMKIIKVEGATGLYDTNYEAKAKAAVDALKEVDLVYLHIEASDEAGHEGDVDLKVKTIEYLDSRVVKYIVEETAKMEEDVALAILPDHPTPCELKTHTHDPVPFLIYKPNNKPDSVECYDELAANNGYFGLLKGTDFMKAFLSQ